LNYLSYLLRYSNNFFSNLTQKFYRSEGIQKNFSSEPTNLLTITTLTTAATIITTTTTLTTEVI
jgi:hypothetical protein